MTEDKSQTISKLSIDKKDDFKFHCAYLAYEKAWDDNEATEAKEKLNELIETLHKNEIGYGFFYSKLDEFRKTMDYNKPMIQSSRKREWRRKETKKNRISRHRKR